VRVSPGKAKGQDREIQSPVSVHPELPVETVVSGGCKPGFGGSQFVSSITDLFCVGR